MLEIVKDGEVVGLIPPGGRFSIPGERVVFNIQIDTIIPGYEVRQHVPPPPPELTPEEVRASMPPLSPRQIRLGLIANGISLAQVEAAIEAIPDPEAKAVARIEWEYASQFQRTHALVAQVADALELSPEQVDAMWMDAVQL